MSKKLLYSAPEAELLVIKFEENIMSPLGQEGYTGAEWDDSNTNDYSDVDL